MEKFNSHAAALLDEAFKRKHIKHSVDTDKINTEVEVIHVPIEVDGCPDAEIELLCPPEGNDISMYVRNLGRIAENEKAQYLLSLNNLNGLYRFIRFYCDCRNEITVSADVAKETPDECLGAETIHLLEQLERNTGYEYPRLVKAVQKGTVLYD